MITSNEELDELAEQLNKAIERMPDELRYMNSDMNDLELANALHNLFHWGVTTGRLLGEGKIKRIDERQWEMVQDTFDKFASSFANRAAIQTKGEE